MTRLSDWARRLIAYLAGGVVGSLVVLSLDLWSLSGLWADANVARVTGLLTSIHLGLGALMGAAAAGAALALGGAWDTQWSRMRSVVAPPPERWPDRAAQVVVWSTLLGVCAAVSWAVTTRFFKFNNVRLAAALLVVFLYALHAVAMVAATHVAPLVACTWARATVGRPGMAHPLVALMWPIGVAAGVAVAAWRVAGTALAETWEALTLAPLVGAALVAFGAYVLEVVLRRRTALSLGLLTLGVVGSGVALAQSPASEMTGADNQVAHLAHWGGMPLSLLERLTDRDKDGFSPRFGHGDCDDADPSAWPGSPEGNDCGPAVELVADAELDQLMGGGAASNSPAAPRRVDPAHARPSPPKTSPPPSEPPEPTAPTPQPRPTPPAPTETVPSDTPAEPEDPVRAKLPMNLVLITVDTVRADHCGFMGYERDTTPRLDEFTGEATVFDKAYAPSNMTPVSIPAILSGQYTTELYRDDGHFIRFGADNEFVAETLSAAGYHTSGVLTHWYFEKRKRSGLDQGFADWTVVGTRWGKAMEDVSTSELVSAEALRQLGTLPSDRPWFLWIHFLDPHKWYIEHKGFDRTWGRKSKDRYDHEIAFTDHHIGIVLDALRKHPQWDRTAVAISSDHGEAFGEHKTHFHGFSMYEDQLRVPFIFRVPGLVAGRVQKRVGLIDLAPTFLELAGLTPSDALRGRSLLPELRGDTVPQRLIYAERPRGPHSAGQRAIIVGDKKLTWRAAGNRYELYDLASDPSESNNLLKTDTATATRLQSLMKSFVSKVLDRDGKVTRKR